MGLWGWVHFAHAEWVAQFEILIEEDLDPVGAFGFKPDVHEELDRGGVGLGSRQLDRDILALDERGVIRFKDAAALNKIAFAATPAVDDAEPLRGGGEAGRTHHIEKAYENEFPVTLLPDIITNQARLQIRYHDSPLGCLHRRP